MDKRIVFYMAFTLALILLVGFTCSNCTDRAEAQGYAPRYTNDAMAPGFAHQSGAVSITPMTLDTLRYLLVFNDTDPSVHVSDKYDAFYALADSIKILNSDVGFEYGVIHTTDPDGAFNSNQDRYGLTVRDLYQLGSVAGDRGAMLRVHWEDLFNCNGDVTVLDCNVNFVQSGSNYQGAGDSLMALIIPDSCTHWYASANLGMPGSANLTRKAQISWDYQYTGADDPSGVPSTSYTGRANVAYPWDWDIQPWELGYTLDIANGLPDSIPGYNAGSTGCSSCTFAAGNHQTINITQTTQAHLNGKANRGVFIHGYSTSQKSYAFWSWQRASMGTHKAIPWIELTVVKRTYAARYPGGKEFAFLFMTDDQADAANTAYAALIDSMNTANGTNWSMTIYVREDGMGSEGRLTYADLYAMWQTGKEISPHSRIHAGFWDWATTGTNPIVDTDRYGFCYWLSAQPYTPTEWTGPGFDSADFTGSATATDSLCWDMDYAWLLASMAATTGDSAAAYDAMYASTNAGKTIACPGNNYTPAVLHVAKDQFNYVGIRTGQLAKMTRSDYQYDWITTGRRGDPLTEGVANYAGRAAQSDTAVMGPAYNQEQWDATFADRTVERRYANQRLHPNTQSSGVIFGDGTAHPSDEAGVKENFRAALMFAIGSGARIMSIYTHDFKQDNPAGTGFYSNGVNESDFRWALEVLAEVDADIGVWMPTVADYQYWRLQHMNAVDTPSDYTQDSGNDFAAAEGVWGRTWNTHYEPRD